MSLMQFIKKEIYVTKKQLLISAIVVLLMVSGIILVSKSFIETKIIFYLIPWLFMTSVMNKSYQSDEGCNVFERLKTSPICASVVVLSKIVYAVICTIVIEAVITGLMLLANLLLAQSIAILPVDLLTGLIIALLIFSLTNYINFRYGAQYCQYDCRYFSY